MSKTKQLARIERRQQRASVPAEGVYGVDADDAGADSWIGRYLCWASSPEEARRRIMEAGFHEKQISQHWSPAKQPPEGTPVELAAGSPSWFRSRWDDDEWTDWEVLPGGYRRPSSAAAAVDPTLR